MSIINKQTFKKDVIDKYKKNKLINLFGNTLCKIDKWRNNSTKNIYYSNLLEILKNISKNQESCILFANKIISKSWLYNISYYNANKEILRMQNIILNIHFSNVFIKTKIEPNSLVVKKSHKIKILIVGFFLWINNAITSVFRDRSKIIEKLNGDIFEKHLITTPYENIKYHSLSISNMLKNLDKITVLKGVNLHNNKNLINELRKCKYDIVIYPSIGMQPWSLIFANNRIAPIQITTWGHSITSGVDTIDYYVSSKLFEDNTYQKNYTEKLICLDSLGTYYNESMHLYDNYKTKKELKLPENKPIIFCLQNRLKINIDFIQMVSKIVNNTTNAILLVRDDNLTNEDILILKTYLGNSYLLIPNCNLYTYNSYMYNSDIVLDPYPFGGCNSSLEAFTKGKIVITLPSDYLPGRFTQGFYKKMGITYPIAKNSEHYCELAIELLKNEAKRKELEAKILEKKHMLFYDEESLKDWENMLIDLHENNKKLNMTTNYSNAIDYLNYNRYDLIFKYIYIKYSELYNNYNNWTRELYINHLKLLNGCYEMKTKFQKEEKHTSSQFVESFNKLIEDFKKNTYESHNIPISYPANLLFNGCHRTACHLYFNTKMPIERINSSSKFICKLEYFTDRQKYKNKLPIPGNDTINNMCDDFLNFSLTEYIKLKSSNVRILICFSQNEYDKYMNTINQILNNTHVNILHRKNLKITKTGMKNVIRELYMNEPHVNVELKTNACFKNKDNEAIQLLFLECDNEDILKEYSKSGGKYKQLIRKHMNNHHSIHVTDNDEETIRLSKILLHDNSVKFYNKYDINLSTNMKTLFNEYTKKLQNVNDIDNYCITSSFIMGLYKLREPNDLDYIHNEKELINIISHNKYKHFYPFDLVDIIYNPKNYFYFKGYKCITLDALKTFKLNRKEFPKDIRDLEKLKI